jgi:hypothetical protein
MMDFNLRDRTFPCAGADPADRIHCQLWGNSGGGGNNQAAAANNPWATNLSIRNLWVRGGGDLRPDIPPALDMWQALNPNLPSGIAPGSVITQQLRNVGLVKRLLVRITATVTAAPNVGDDLTLTKLGLANLVSNVTFTDLANNTRINTTGWHLTAVASAKRRTVFGAAYASDTPFGYGNNFTTVNQAPPTINHNTSANIQFMLEIPFAYSDHDLSGAIFADVTQATMQVALTLNPNMFVASGADATLAVYQSGSANLPTLSNVAVQIYQNYLTQGPRQQNGLPILPQLDLATAYVLNNTSSALPVANQDNVTPFINSRKFLSLCAIYDNAGTLNTGSDINSLAIVSATFTNITKLDPFTQAFMGRNVIGDDFPPGMYYFDFRARPIDTNQYGNMAFVFNPSSVGGASATVLFGYEALGFIGQINSGGSLPSGGGQ